MTRFLRMWLRRCARFAHYSLVALGLLVVIVVASPFTSWYARLLARPWPDPKGDTLIVLAGSESEDGIMGRSTYFRCAYAIRVFREGSFHRVVVSGRGVAYTMRDFLVYHGVPESMIVVEDKANSTRESAVFVRNLLARTPGSYVLLTSDFHLFRARRAFERAGLPVLACPFPDAIKYSKRLEGRLPAFIFEAMETAKIAYYFARGWL